MASSMAQFIFLVPLSTRSTEPHARHNLSIAGICGASAAEGFTYCVDGTEAILLLFALRRVAGRALRLAMA